MIVIQIILIAGFFAFLIKLLADPNSHKMKAWTKILGVVFGLVAIVVVLFPGIADHVARLVGVAGGADLLLYLLTLAFIFVVFNLYVKSKQDDARLVELARKIAILEANSRQKKIRK